MFGIPIVGGDETYLRLDASNGPLDGDLLAQSVSPRGSDSYNLGTSLSRWSTANINTITCNTLVDGTALNFRNTQDVESGIVIDDDVSAGTRMESWNLLGEIGPAFTGGTQTIDYSSVGQYTAPNLNMVGLSGVGKGAPTLSIVNSGNGAIFAPTYYSPWANTGTTVTMSNSNWGSLLLGVAADRYDDSELTLSSTNGFAVGGNITGGFVTTPATSGTSKVANNNAGFLTGGSVTFGFANGSTIETTASGTFCTGYATASASLRTTAPGAFTTGYANGSGSAVLASGQGAMATGECNAGGTITASGAGSFAHGSVGAASACTASAANSVQWGVGVNAEADTVSAGTMIRIKGTAGAPGVPRNGDVYVTAGGFVTAQSNAKAVQLNTGAAAWTAGTYATRRSFAGLLADGTAAADAEILELLETLIDELQTANHIN